VSPQEDRSAQLASFVLGDAQDTWTQILARENIRYPRAKLVLFRDYTQSGCGAAQSATGPFYCPADQKVYLDLGFWDQLQRYGASGEFAQAYVVAHEIGHHVQNVIGIERKVRAMQQQNPRARNQLSVAVELQADCFAGVWANSTAKRNIINQADVQSGLQAAAAVGDDRLQKMAQGYVTPDSFTHGSSQQRVAWFNRGLNSGQVTACNTFAAGQ
jgi:predicted metalloprotease